MWSKVPCSFNLSCLNSWSLSHWRFSLAVAIHPSSLKPNVVKIYVYVQNSPASVGLAQVHPNWVVMLRNVHLAAVIDYKLLTCLSMSTSPRLKPHVCIHICTHMPRTYTAWLANSLGNEPTYSDFNHSTWYGKFRELQLVNKILTSSRGCYVVERSGPLVWCCSSYKFGGRLQLHV